MPARLFREGPQMQPFRLVLRPAFPAGEGEVVAKAEVAASPQKARPRSPRGGGMLPTQAGSLRHAVEKPAPRSGEACGTE